MNTHFEQLKKFLSLYDMHNDLNFSQLPLYKQTKVIQPFGLSFIDNTINFECGTYFGRKNSFLYTTQCPFDFYKVDYFEDEDLIVLYSSFGFSIRLYFIKYETITVDFWQALDNKKSITKGTIVGKSGKLRPLKTTLAYIEVLSEKNENLLLDLLTIKYESYFKYTYSSDDIIYFLNIFGINHKSGFEQIKRLEKEKQLTTYNSFYSLQYDSKLDKEMMFYSWNALFF